MTSFLHRRALLQGALALPLAFAGAMAAADHPDVKFIAFQPEIERLDRAYWACRRRIKPSALRTARRSHYEAAQKVRQEIETLGREIAATPAQTLEGLIWKARYADAHFPGDPDGEVICSIYDDVLKIAGLTSRWLSSSDADEAAALS